MADLIDEEQSILEEKDNIEEAVVEEVQAGEFIPEGEIPEEGIYYYADAPPQPTLVGDEITTEFMDWASGKEVELPPQLNKVMNNLLTKLSVGLGLSVVGSITRQENLNAFLVEAERKLFNKDLVNDMTMEEVDNAYKTARQTVTGLQEFQRKFISQNKETLKISNTPQEKMMNKIMSMSPSKIAVLMEQMEMLDTMDTQSTDPTEGYPEDIEFEDDDLAGLPDDLQELSDEVAVTE